MKASRARSVALCGALAGVALIFGYVEALIPIPFPVPGMKLGLANIAVVVALWALGPREALAVNLVRVAVSALLFGTLMSLWFSLAGCLLSFAAMAVLKKTGLMGITGVSAVGGIFHNVGQLAVAAFVLGTASILYYLPFLLLAGLVTGLALGFAAAACVPAVIKLRGK